MSTWTLSDESFKLLAAARHAVERERDVLREALSILAAYPLEEFGLENKADCHPLFGANSWQLTAGHVRKARAALSQEIPSAVHSGPKR